MSNHTNFLQNYANAGDHYGLQDHPLGFVGKVPTQEILDAASKHHDPMVRGEVMLNKEATVAHIDSAIRDTHNAVRRLAAGRLQRRLGADAPAHPRGFPNL